MTDTLEIEAGKEYLLRDGLKMICYATHANGSYPIHGAFYEEDGSLGEPSTWKRTGEWSGATRDEVDIYDIISEAPEPIEVDCWVDVYQGGFICPTGLVVVSSGVVTVASPKPVAKKRVQFTVLPGEGL